VAASKGINVATLYVEDEDGKVIDGFRASAIRHVAYRIFNEFLAAGVAAASWGMGGTAITRQYYNEMALQIPEMRYCDNHWKADYLAKHIYPSWIKARAGKVKAEPVEDTDAGLVGKRVQDEESGSGMTSQKKSKTGRSKTAAPS